MNRWQSLARILAFSLAVTAGAAAIAWGIHSASGARFLLVFVYARWAFVVVLLGTAILARHRPNLPLPYAARTPLTALFLTCESILVDIVVAQIRH